MVQKPSGGRFAQYVNVMRTLDCVNAAEPYDAEADTLYVNYEKPSHATDSEMADDDVIVRYEGEEVIGLLCYTRASVSRKRRRPEYLRSQMRQAVQGRRSRQRRVKVVGALAQPSILAAIRDCPYAHGDSKEFDLCLSLAHLFIVFVCEGGPQLFFVLFAEGGLEDRSFIS